MSGQYPMERLTPENTAIVLIDHQAGLVVGVQDHDQSELRRNARALARAAVTFDIPLVVTTSGATGPNGPLIPDLAQELADGLTVIDRPGEIDAFDNSDVVTAIEATGKANLVIGAISTDVCLTFASLSARSRDFGVHAALDASGAFNLIARETSLARLDRAGVVLNSTFAILSELLGDWRSPVAEDAAALFGELAVPFYGAVVASRYANEAAEA